jgi:hypothetical protein
MCGTDNGWVNLCGCVPRYVLGMPAIFALFLWRNRVEVRSDQLMRERGEGDSALTNPHIQVIASPPPRSLTKAPE